MLPSWADQLLPQLLMEQFDTFPIQYRHIEHMHEGVWVKKNNFWQNASYENLDNYFLIWLLYMHGPINSYHSFWWSNLILCPYNADILNICMEEFIIFVCTDSTEIFFSKLSSAGLNYNLSNFFTESYCAGVSNKHCLLTFFICELWLAKAWYGLHYFLLFCLETDKQFL